LAVAASPRVFRLAIIATHPVQYQVPLYRRLARCSTIDLTVFFCSAAGAESYFDRGFGRQVQWDRPLRDGYRWEVLPNLSMSPDVSRFWGVVNPAVLTRLRGHRFDAVMLQGWSRLTHLLALAVGRAMGVPILMRAEASLLAARPRWKERLKKPILAALFKRVDAFLAIGRGAREFYRAYGVEEVRIFDTPYAVDNEFFLARAQELGPVRREIRAKRGLSDAPVVLFCGKLGPVKAPGVLLDAFAMARPEVKARLVFVGDGPLRAVLEERARSRGLRDVLFPGFRNQSELPEWYAAADLLVVPSESETWGLVINEAMCFGLPVIVSDRVGAGLDLVRDGENGFVFRKGDVGQLASCLATLLRDAELRQRMGRRSNEAIRRWSYEEDLAGVLACLESVVPRGGVSAEPRRMIHGQLEGGK